MGEWLAKRRFNVIDAVGAAAGATLLVGGRFLTALIVIVVGAAISVWIETIAARNTEERT